MWFEFHDSARDHPKILKLARDLKISEGYALGLMSALWSWALRMAPDGDLSSFDSEDIEIGAKWDGEPGAFVSAAVARKLLDKTASGLVIHDWFDFAGSLKVAKRMRESRERKRNDSKRVRNGNVTVRNGDVTLRGPTDRQTDRPNEIARAREPEPVPTFEKSSPGLPEPDATEPGFPSGDDPESARAELDAFLSGATEPGWRTGEFGWLKVAGCWQEITESIEEPYHHQKAFESIARSCLKMNGGDPRVPLEKSIRTLVADPFYKQKRPGPNHLARNFTKYAAGPIRSKDDEDYKDMARRLRQMEDDLSDAERFDERRKIKAIGIKMGNLRNKMEKYLRGET